MHTLHIEGKKWNGDQYMALDLRMVMMTLTWVSSNIKKKRMNKTTAMIMKIIGHQYLSS